MLNPVTKSNFYLNFNEGAGELTAELNVSSYTMSTIGVEISRAMNEVGTQEYTVTFDRDTRKLTISAASNFDLLIFSGSNIGLGVFTLIGFTGADQTGTNSYEGDAIGSTYTTQFLPQDFKSFDHNKKGISPSINESASGEVEIITFGDNKFMEFNIKYITDKARTKGSAIENNPTGIQDTIDFLEFATGKSKMEFMQDRDNPASFDLVLLERTAKDKMGVGYELKEDKKLIGYFETGKLQFRKLS